MEAAAKFILQRIFKYLGYANNLLNNGEVHKRDVKRNNETPRDMLECTKLNELINYNVTNTLYPGTCIRQRPGIK